jgi:two-component system chemotaxis response regulator CheB
VLIVDDSQTARIALRSALNSDVAIQIVGEVGDGVAAVEHARRLRPDLITMDVYMKGKDGLEVTAEIMRTQPTPILVVTADNPQSSSLVYRAMQAGALDVCGKPPSALSPDYTLRRHELTKLIKKLAKVAVVGVRHALAPHPASTDRTGDRERAAHRWTPPELLLLGASTGGPPLLCELLRRLPPDLTVPVAMVQHMAPGFVAGFAQWLESEAHRTVVLVAGRTTWVPQTVYLAPDDCHLEVAGPDCLAPRAGPPLHYQRPSVDVLFSSAAQQLGARAVAVLMSGMGRDGAEGLERLLKAGAMTFAQEPSTCIVDSMPRAAIRRGAAREVVSPEELPDALARIWRVHVGNRSDGVPSWRIRGSSS